MTDGNEVEPLAAVEVAKLAEDGKCDRSGKEIGRKHPAVEMQTAEVGYDGGHGRPDHERVHGAQKEGQKGRRNDQKFGSATAGEGSG